MKKITSCFLAKSKKCHLAILPKMCQKLNFSQIWHFLYLSRKAKVIFFAKKNSLFVYWPRQKNANSQQNWVFGPFLAIWLSDIFWSWSENKKWFFHKIGCINNPKLLWNILLLRPDVEDFKTWLFFIFKGSPLML